MQTTRTLQAPPWAVRLFTPLMARHVARALQKKYPGLGAAEIAERLFARGTRFVLGIRRGRHEERQAESQGERLHWDRPMRERNWASSSTVTPSRLASSAFEPGSSPTIT